MTTSQSTRITPRWSAALLTGALAIVAAISCRPTHQAAAPASAPHIVFWQRVVSLCGRAFAGTLTEGAASDSVMRRAKLVMHVRGCTADTIRIPFHVDSNRSRTWVITRTATGLRLKHDHRHADGSEDAVTQYGGDTQVAGTASAQEFHADSHTATLIPAARTNIWTMEVVPGQRFAYALRRVGTDRRFRVDFDLSRSITPPPPPWGSK